MSNRNNPANVHRASRIRGIEISDIVQISEKAAALRASGRDVVALSTGEPDFPTPGHVIEAAHQAALAGQTKYTATVGTLALRTAIADLADVGPTEVLVSTGAKQVICNTFLATLDPGDEVVMPTPYWTSYSDMVRMAGGVPVTVPCPVATGFKLGPEALEAAITPRTRWLLLNSPSNPTGAIYSVAEIAALAKVLRGHPDVWIMADEIYEHLSFVPFTSFVSAAPELRDRTLIVNGMSKAWAMTGWRIGWGIGPPSLIDAIAAVQGQITSGACSIAQAAALAAITGDQQLLHERRAILLARRQIVVESLNRISGLDCPVPDGAFYVFPACHPLLTRSGGRFADDAELCTWLLDTTGVAVVPGRVFGMAGHFRLSFAYAQSQIEDGISRIARALAR